MKVGRSIRPRLDKIKVTSGSHDDERVRIALVIDDFKVAMIQIFEIYPATRVAVHLGGKFDAESGNELACVIRSAGVRHVGKMSRDTEIRLQLARVRNQ